MEVNRRRSGVYRYQEPVSDVEPRAIRIMIGRVYLKVHPGY